MMKWWGWGRSDFEFPMHNKPSLWPWIRQKLGLVDPVKSQPVARAQITLPAPVLNAGFCAALARALKTHQITSNEDERLLHAYGKSYPDLLRVRRGEVTRAPDLVVLPESHEDVERIVALAQTFDVCVVPFGGGTNIVGAVNPCDAKQRMVVSLDLRAMSRVLSVDPYSMTAVIQAGALGPDLERQLQDKGFSLGHYPDSFEHSTLGGWLATRSAGMQSDAYGKIEDMCVALRFVTASGTLVTRPVPTSSAGPDLNRFVIGSEGTLGVITEATMRVHPTPVIKDYRGFLFKDFEVAVQAVYECAHNGLPPSMMRLQDSGETELALNLKSPKKGLEAWIQKPIKRYLKAQGYTAPCILLIGFEGGPGQTKASREAALKIIKRHGGFSLGRGVGKTWSADKFNVPYLRDFIMDYGCMVDVSETAALWSQVVPLHRNVIAAVKNRFAAEFGAGYVGCHISHTYETGACLYFTYAAKQVPGQELAQYYTYKRLVTDTIMQSGGTVSHHHAIGTEHLPWMEEEVSPTGLQALRALKRSLDPKAIFNPGKLLPPERAVAGSAEAASDAELADSFAATL